MKNSWIESVRRQLAHGDLTESIERILQLVKSDNYYSKIAIQLSSSYHRYLRNEKAGTIPVYDKTLETITHNLIELLYEIESDAVFNDFTSVALEEERANNKTTPNALNFPIDTRHEASHSDFTVIQVKGSHTSGLRIPQKNETIVDALYRDLAKPSFERIGKALGNSFGLINTLTLPLEYINQVAYATFRKNLDDYLHKIKILDADDTVEVPKEIAVPILDKLFFVSNEELVNLFTNLLLRSSTATECNLAHPNFTNIISSISPDEARILNKQKGNPIPIIYPTITYTKEEKDNVTRLETIRSKSYFSNLENEIEIIFPNNLQLYTENLSCLGILESFGIRTPRSYDLSVVASLKRIYKKEIEQFYAQNSELLNEPALHAKKEVEFGQLSFTEFGKLFIRACCDPE